MKINTLRHFDIWIGRPICWLLTFIYKVGQILSLKEKDINTQKILFVKLFGIGSAILAMPSIEAVKKKLPETQIFFLTFKGNESVLTLTNLIPQQNIYTVRRDNLINFAVDVVRCLFKLKHEKIDVFIDLEFFARSTAILSFFLSKCRIGYYGFYTEGLKRGKFINYPISYNHTLHTSRSYFSLLKPLGICQEEFNPNIPKVHASEGFKNKVQTLIHDTNESLTINDINKWVVINPNTSDLIDLRKWPSEYFVKLADQFLNVFDDLGIILIGSQSEAPYVEILYNKIIGGRTGTRVINLAGKTSIANLMDLFHFSNLLITNDSGPAHLASLTDISTIVLFGPETPELYSPLGGNAKCFYLGLDCQPCVTIYNGKHSYCHNNICLKKILPETVYKRAIEMLGR